MVVELSACALAPTVGIILAELIARHSQHTQCSRVACRHGTHILWEQLPWIWVVIVVSQREDLIPRRMVFVHDIGSRKAVAGIVGLGGMGMEIALVLVHCRPINIGVWVVGYSRDDGLSVHHLDIYCAVRFGGCAIEFDV